VAISQGGINHSFARICDCPPGNEGTFERDLAPPGNHPRAQRARRGERRGARHPQLKRGDRLVYVVSWQRLGGTSSLGGGFTVTNPLPRTVYYQRSAAGDEQVSVDGGKRWGKLESLRIGARIATPEDVTHLRWRVAPGEASKGAGRITYSAIVR
jgi:hypothetical protein